LSLSRTYSLVIPSFNRLGLIEATLDAALSQTRTFAEVIVVDDGSTDGTAAALAASHPAVRVIRTGRCGTQEARNVGLLAARGEWVVLCDSDDLLDPDYLESVDRAVGAGDEVDAVFTNFRLIGESGLLRPDGFDRVPPGWWREPMAQSGEGFLLAGQCDALRLLEHHPLLLSGLAIRRDHLAQVGGFDPAVRGMKGEHVEFTLRVVAASRVFVLSRPLWSYRKHAGSDSMDDGALQLGVGDVLEYAARHAPGWLPVSRTRLKREARAARIRTLEWGVHHARWDVAREAALRIGVLPRSLRLRMKHRLALSSPRVQHFVARSLQLGVDMRGTRSRPLAPT
jgi:GT2 family glycosyltransferase